MNDALAARHHASAEGAAPTDWCRSSTWATSRWPTRWRRRRTSPTPPSRCTCGSVRRAGWARSASTSLPERIFGRVPLPVVGQHVVGDACRAHTPTHGRRARPGRGRPGHGGGQQRRLPPDAVRERWDARARRRAGGQRRRHRPRPRVSRRSTSSSASTPAAPGRRARPPTPGRCQQRDGARAGPPRLRARARHAVRRPDRRHRGEPVLRHPAAARSSSTRSTTSTSPTSPPTRWRASSRASGSSWSASSSCPPTAAPTVTGSPGPAPAGHAPVEQRGRRRAGRRAAFPGAVGGVRRRSRAAIDGLRAWLDQQRAAGRPVGGLRRRRQGQHVDERRRRRADDLVLVADGSEAKQGRSCPGSHVPVAAPPALAETASTTC